MLSLSLSAKKTKMTNDVQKVRSEGKVRKQNGKEHSDGDKSTMMEALSVVSTW